MTIQEIDERLARWQADLNTITSNMLELQGHVVYQIAEKAPLRGLTKDKVDAAMKALGRIWSYLSLLHGVIDKAVAARAALPKLFQAKALAEIEELLTGNSVKFEAVEVPLEERDLLSSSEKVETTTPDKLKEVMVQSFAEAKKNLLALWEVWSKLVDAMKDITQEAERLKGEAESYGKGTPAEISDLLARISSLEKRRLKDPLSIDYDVKVYLQPYLQAARIRVVDLAREREQIGYDLKRAAGELEAVKVLRVKALELYQQCQVEIKDADGPKAPGSAKELTNRLDDLSKAHKEQRWETARVGLIDWFESCRQFKVEVEAVISANQKLIEKRKALLARWAAAKRKTEEYKPKGLVVDKALSTFAEKVEELIKGQVDLAAADQMIYSYETRLGELISRLEA